MKSFVFEGEGFVLVFRIYVYLFVFSVTVDLVECLSLTNCVVAPVHAELLRETAVFRVEVP